MRNLANAGLPAHFENIRQLPLNRSVSFPERCSRNKLGAGELQALKLKSAYGFAVQISTGYGITTIVHGGVAPGYSAQLQWYPDLGYEVVVLSNFGDTAAHIVAQTNRRSRDGFIIEV